MAKFTDTTFIHSALQTEIDFRVAEIMKEEVECAVERASENIRRRIKEKVDQIGLNILKQYQVRMAGDEIIITVRNIEDVK